MSTIPVGKEGELFKRHFVYSHYDVGNMGTIISYRNPRVNGGLGKVLGLWKSNVGYLKTGVVTSEGKNKQVYVHRLVAETWVKNPMGLEEVNHIDHDKENVAADNLEWVTHAENIAKARIFLGNWSKDCGKGKRRPLIATDVEAGDEVEWESGRAAAISMGNANRAANICAALATGRPAYGFLWRYKDAKPIPPLVVPDDGYRSPVFGADDMSIREVIA